MFLVLSCLLSFSYTPLPGVLGDTNLVKTLGFAAESLQGQAIAYLILRKGMEPEDVQRSLGTPSIEYSACGHTTYVYQTYHLQLWFESDCPRKLVVSSWQGKEETSIIWASNPSLPCYRHKLVRVRYCPL
jgi:hypothetical protein